MRQLKAINKLIDLTEGGERDLLNRLKVSAEQQVLLTNDEMKASQDFFQKVFTADNQDICEACASVGVEATNAAGVSFTVRGVPVQCFGQLPPTTKVQIAKAVEKIVDE